MASDDPTGQGATALDILFVTRKWAPAMGGMETYCHRLTEELARSHHVEVVALPGRPDGQPPAWPALLAFPFTVLRRFATRGAAPDVLHLADMAIWPLGLLALLAWGPVRIVLSAHGTDVSYPRRGGFRGRMYGAYLRLGARLLGQARVIANSRATAGAVTENGWPDPAIVPLATDMRGPVPDGTHDGTILFAGRLVERKGCGWFIRNVLPLLPDTIILRVAGTCWDEDERAALFHPRVEALGNLDPALLRQAYAGALCVIVPNIAMPNGEFEGFGLVAAEAAAAGGLVLAANREGLTEAVIDGETGFHVTAGDAPEWARVISGLAGWEIQKRRDFLQGAMARAQGHYSWQRVARKTLAGYDVIPDWQNGQITTLAEACDQANIFIQHPRK